MPKIYLGTEFAKKEVGEVSPDGMVYSGSGLLREVKGSVNENGKVYAGTGESQLVGEISEDGKIYSNTGIFKRQVGEVSNDGTVYSGTGFLKRAIGKVGESSKLDLGMLGNKANILNLPSTTEKEPSRILPEGAALLLLFHEQPKK